MEDITFVGLTNEDRVTFDNKELRIILKNVLEPIVKVENCIWLSEDYFEKRTNVGNTEGVREIFASDKKNFEGKIKY